MSERVRCGPCRAPFILEDGTVKGRHREGCPTGEKLRSRRED